MTKATKDNVKIGDTLVVATLPYNNNFVRKYYDNYPAGTEVAVAGFNDTFIQLEGDDKDFVYERFELTNKPNNRVLIDYAKPIMTVGGRHVDFFCDKGRIKGYPYMVYVEDGDIPSHYNEYGETTTNHLGMKLMNVPVPKWLNI